tara:strand:- start:282 stop:575 length:294 start_codon:yes stop_codon:yes gene_type:complete
MKYTIDSIRTYQAVMFDKVTETFFSTRQINQRFPVKLELIESLNVVSIKNESDHILVPLTNVSAVYLKSPLKIKQEKNELEEKMKLNAKSIKNSHRR